MARSWCLCYLGGAAVDAEKSKAAGVEALRAKKRLTMLTKSSQNVAWGKLLSQCSQFDILASLHPSPAVCRFPTEEARLFIAETGVSLFLCFCGGLEMKKCKAWESETESLEYQFTNVNSPPYAGYTNDSAGQMGRSQLGMRFIY
nr:uncharacterized protein LOC112013073 isoform X1 [Quercus suber]